jgi:hypothetical protein
MKKTNNFFASLKLLKKESDPELDPEPDPDPLVRGTDPRIRTKMLGIPNNVRTRSKIVVCSGLTSLTSRQSGGPLLPPTTIACSGGDPSLISQHRRATQHQRSVKL